MAPLLALVFLQQGFGRVESQYVQGIPVVAAESASGQKIWLVLDTGSALSIYNGALQEGKSGVTLKIGGKAIEVPTTRNADVAESPSVAGNIGISGVVGCDFLKSRQAFLDLAHSTVSFREGPPLNPNAAEKVLRDAQPDLKESRLACLTLEFDGQRYRTQGRIGGKPILWTFDTGANHVFVADDFFQSPSSVTMASREVSRAYGTDTLHRRLFPLIEVGPKRVLAPAVGDRRKDGEQGVIGPVLLARDVLLDLPGKRVYWLESTHPLARVDEAIGRLAGLLMRTAADGRLIINHQFEGPDIVLHSIQGVTVAALRKLVTKAVSGDRTAMERMAKLWRERETNRNIWVSFGHDGLPMPMP
jgi:hypothetical protein